MSQAYNKIIEISKKLYDRGYIVSKSGNVSCRIDKDRILITPSRYRKHELGVKDLSVIDLNGKVIEGCTNPSSEYRVHLAIYKKRPDVKAIVHGHAHYAIVCSLATISFEYPILTETAISLGSIPTVAYAAPGSEELAELVGPAMVEHNSVIMERHGVVAVGDNLEDAFDRLEETEHAAKVAYHLSLKGRIPVLGRAHLVKVVEFAKKQGLPVPKIALNLLHKLLSQ